MSGSSRSFRWPGPEERLDRVLTDYCLKSEGLAGYSRSQIRQWIERGAVSVNGKRVLKAGTFVMPEAVVQFEGPVAESSKLEPWSVDLKILYEDSEILVVDKPAGITMHPGAGNRSRTLVNALIARSSGFSEDFGNSERPGVVHRLDKDTSGVVVVARNAPAHAALAKQFAAREVEREYLALVYTPPRAATAIRQHESGVIDLPLGRHPSRRKEFAVVAVGGKSAVTKWKIVRRIGYGTLLSLRLGTGRTHQIRVHLAHIGAPLIGDPVYGRAIQLPQQLERAAARFGRQALHAATLGFIHPLSGKELRFESAVPPDLRELVEAFEELQI